LPAINAVSYAEVLLRSVVVVVGESSVSW